MSHIDLHQPPAFCQYASGPCDQIFEGTKPATGIFLFPSHPTTIADTIERAAEDLELSDQSSNWLTWTKFSIAGQVIFCTICKRMRFADFIAADVTTLNLNLMFEIGFALGIRVPVVPIRDTSFIEDESVFRELGILDTIGYLDFRNSTDLVQNIRDLDLPTYLQPASHHQINPEAPLYLVKSRYDTEGELVLTSFFKRSYLPFRTYDPNEMPRLSFHEASRQVSSSVGVAAHLLHENRDGAQVHNARCAFIAGLAMAQQKNVILLQEGEFIQPIDYRDVVQSYTRQDQLGRLLEHPMRQLTTRCFERSRAPAEAPAGLIYEVDFGDVAAENEIVPLRSYFVATGQYNEAKRGHARLVVGRKGSGKTAIFYSLVDYLDTRSSHLLLDLKPEGHQFVRLRESVLEELSPGLREHTLTAFWNSILLTELARKIADTQISWANRDSDRLAKFDKVVALDDQFGVVQEGDFSERLQVQVDRLVSRFEERRPNNAAEVTELLFLGDIQELAAAVIDFLELKQETWLLVDNLDRGWPTRGLEEIDVLIVRTLLEATRKLQRQFSKRDVELRSLVFLRNDVFEHLIRETPDRGKDTAIELDWTDRETLKELVRKRITTTTALAGDFDHVWAAIFEPTVGYEPSFHYMVDRTLMRPRDLLMFIRRAVEVAINRNHERVTEEDIRSAEKSYSYEMLRSIEFELQDVVATAGEWPYEFIGCSTKLSAEDTRSLLRNVVEADQLGKAIEFLVWFGFVGVRETGKSETRYSFQTRHDLRTLLRPIDQNVGHFVIHPAFRVALECSDN